MKLSSSIREEQLETIASVLENWIEFAIATRQKEGLLTEGDTYIISPPPHWPSVGVLKNWIAAIRNKESNPSNTTEE